MIEVKIDRQPLAKLDVRLFLMKESLDYKINSLFNVSETYVKASTSSDTNANFADYIYLLYEEKFYILSYFSNSFTYNIFLVI